MAATHDLHLLESEENDIRWAANEDAQQERIRLINQVTELVAENLRLKKAIQELSREVDKRAEPNPNGTIAARLNWWKDRCDELHECRSIAIKLAKHGSAFRLSDAAEWAQAVIDLKKMASTPNTAPDLKPAK